MRQLPPLSHCASLSHAVSGAALAVPATARGAPAATAPTTARRARTRPLAVRGREVMLVVSFGAAEVYPAVIRGSQCTEKRGLRFLGPVPSSRRRTGTAGQMQRGGSGRHSGALG